MSIITTPEIKRKICDWCNKDITKSGGASKAHMEFDSAGLDYQGQPVGPGASFKHDYCDGCASEVLDLLREGQKTSKAKIREEFEGKK